MGLEAPRPGAVIVGEPTELQVADAHKSVVTFTTYVHGHEAHSSKPSLGANAVSGAAELVVELDRIGEMFRARGDPTGRFDPPYATVHVGTIHGGTARNIVPSCAPSTGRCAACRARTSARRVAMLNAHAEAVVLPRLRATGWPASVETDRRGGRARPRAGPRLSCRDAGAAPRRPQRHRSPCPTRRRPASSRGTGCRRSFAGRDRSTRRTSPTSTSTLDEIERGVKPSSAG